MKNDEILNVDDQGVLKMLILSTIMEAGATVGRLPNGGVLAICVVDKVDCQKPFLYMVNVMGMSLNQISAHTIVAEVVVERDDDGGGRCSVEYPYGGDVEEIENCDFVAYLTSNMQSSSVGGFRLPDDEVQDKFGKYLHGEILLSS
ncbi:MAG: hypothetical protein DRP09_15825 [Candidatus Thorarchaeota archaeon]|nr:MAG: hypothetical protein DRP09_15825 [Candidatus Thorarchaeota archaeon]